MNDRTDSMMIKESQKYLNYPLSEDLIVSKKVVKAKKSPKLRKNFIENSLMNNSKVFDRLYDDHVQREERLVGLKNHLEKLEELHWEEILTVLNLY